MGRPPITAKGRLRDKQLNAALAWLESAGGGGGGPSAWGTITGTLTAQTDLTTALNGKAASTHTHAQSDVTGLVSALAGIPAKGVATVTVPNGRNEWSETVTAAGVAASDVLIVSVAPHADSDENDAELLDMVCIAAAAGTDQATFTLTFSAPTAGAIKLNWMAA